MARQRGTLDLGSNIEPNMSAPLDARTVVQQLTDLTTQGTFTYWYAGMRVSVLSESKVYLLTGSDPTDPENWVALSKGGDGYSKKEVDDLLDDKADKSTTYTKTEVDAELAIKADQATTYTKTEVDTELALKADQATTYTKTEVDTELALKADQATTYTKTEVDAELALKANQDTTYTKTEVDSELALKADQATTYTKTEVDAELALKADQATTYTKTEVDTELALKANVSDVYDKTDIDTALALKADQSTTYTKTEVDAELALKADQATTYSKSEVDIELALKADQDTTYTKTEVDNALALKANLSGAIFTGAVQVPNPSTGSDDTSAANTAFVNAAIASAIASIVQIRFDGDTTGLGYVDLTDLETKHPVGENGVFYLVQNSGSAPNVFDEYFWDSNTLSYEKFGTTEIDLSPYLKSADCVELDAASVATIWNTIFNDTKPTS